MARGQGLPLDPEALRSARQRAGMSQRQVAEALGTTRQQIIRYEQGAERPEVKRLAALARTIGVTVGDLVEEGSLPTGLAGLRIGAGLTLAAAAGAVRSRLPQGAGIACSRPVLAEAERGTLPPTWAPETSAGAVRTAFGTVYETGPEEVTAAWTHTFGPASLEAPTEPENTSSRNHPPTTRDTEQAGFINGTPNEEISETTPSSPDPAWMPGLDDSPEATDDQEHNRESPGVMVLVSGGPQSAQVYMDGDYVGHLEHRHSWDQQGGWTYRVQLADTDRTHMNPNHQDAPDAATSLTDIAAALPVLLEEAHGHPVPITDLSGERTDLPIRGRDMERWELRRGRVSGREDIYVRSRCWGWLQRDEKGFTAHTTEGPVPGAPAPTREDAASALWAHLTAPLPPPSLGARARTKRRLRSHATLARPMCPYSPAELARVSVVEAPASKTGARLYQAVAPDGVVLGFLWRSGRGWSRCAPTPKGAMPDPLPVGASFPSRREALESLLAQPGPLWGDPAEVIVH